eukprot:359214_1
MSTVRELSFANTYDFSSSYLKRLFIVWFNAISDDTTCITSSQFSTVLTRIFSSSTSSLSQQNISEIFKQLSNNKTNIYYSQFLSQNENTFINIMTELLSIDDIAMSVLQSVPDLHSNNSSNNTIQQTIYDQAIEISTLKQWITEIGIPSNVRQNTLQTELELATDNKLRLDLQLELAEEAKNDLQLSQDSIHRQYGALEDNYTYAIQQITDLKSINNEHKELIDKLEHSLHKTEIHLLNEIQENKQYQHVVENLTKLNKQYKKTNNQLLIKNQNQTNQIQQLINMNQKMEIAMESTAMTLEQKTEEINKLQHELQILQSNDDNHEHNYNEFLPVRNKLTEHRKRKSYIFSIKSPVMTPENAHKRRSILSVGGGRTMSVFDGSDNGMNLSVLNEKPEDFHALLHDELNGVDVFVYDQNDNIENQPLWHNDNISTRSNDTYLELDEKVDDIDTLHDMQIKHDLEMIKFKQKHKLHKKDKNSKNSKKQKKLIDVKNKIKFQRRMKKGRPQDKHCFIFGFNLW